MRLLNVCVSVVIGAALFPTHASAGLVFTDDFSISQPVVLLLEPGISSSTLMSAPAVGFDRTLTVAGNVLNSAISVADGALRITTGPDTDSDTNVYGIVPVGSGFLVTDAGGNAESAGTVSFDLNALDPIPLLTVELRSSAVGDPALDSLVISPTGVPTRISLGGIGDFTNGFALSFAGEGALNLEIDNLTFVTVPEPASLVLVGLALLAAGATSRGKALIVIQAVRLDADGRFDAVAQVSACKESRHTKRSNRVHSGPSMLRRSRPSSS